MLLCDGGRHRHRHQLHRHHHPHRHNPKLAGEFSGERAGYDWCGGCADVAAVVAGGAGASEVGACGGCADAGTVSGGKWASWTR